VIDLGFQLEADLAAAVEAIRTDATAGPIQLARRGAEVVLRLTDKSYYERPLQIVLEVQGLGRALLAARPDCMPLATLACETVRPLPELYGRGKSEGARMRGDLRTRIEAWLGALDERAVRISAQRRVGMVTAQAVSLDAVFVLSAEGLGGRPRYAVAGVEKFVPPNWEFYQGATGLQRVPLEEWDGILTGDASGPVSIESVRLTIASLRFEPVLL